LIELLTVIAIVLILAGIMIPVVNSVQDKARLAQCISNHRQVASAYLLYLGDNKNQLWAQGTRNYAVNQPRLGGWGYAMLGAQETEDGPGRLCYLLESYGLRRAKYDNGKAIPDRKRTMWYCPLVSTLSDIAGHGCSYRYYHLGQWVGLANKPVTATAVADYWATKPFMSDHYGDHNATENRASPTDENLKNVYAFLDGHVKFYAPAP
jgi:type II secretory pathway pseudopilin PulG